MTKWIILLPIALILFMGPKIARGITNNNPGNIKYSPTNKWRGQIGESEGFVMFSDVSYGFRAMGILLRNYRKQGYISLRQIITRYAPPNENDTSHYVDFVAGRVGIDPDSSLSDIQFEASITAIIKAMARMEVGKDYSSSVIASAVKPQLTVASGPIEPSVL